MQDLKIARDANSKRDQMFLKSPHVLQSADPKNGFSDLMCSFWLSHSK